MINLKAETFVKSLGIEPDKAGYLIDYIDSRLFERNISTQQLIHDAIKNGLIETVEEIIFFAHTCGYCLGKDTMRQQLTQISAN